MKQQTMERRTQERIVCLNPLVSLIAAARFTRRAFNVCPIQHICRPSQTTKQCWNYDADPRQVQGWPVFPLSIGAGVQGERGEGLVMAQGG
jgi:hypothetical protein